MPRYYFHLSNGKQVLNNHKGIDLSGNAAARELKEKKKKKGKRGVVLRILVKGRKKKIKKRREWRGEKGKGAEHTVCPVETRNIQY